MSLSAQAPNCNSANGTLYLSAATQEVFNITCGYQIPNNDLYPSLVNSFQACIELCTQVPGCNNVAYGNSGQGSGSTYVTGTGAGTCYMKSLPPPGTGGLQPAAISTAIYQYTLPLLACPTNDTATYSAVNGGTFTVQCYQDHVGGDAAMAVTSTYQSCLATCANTNGCVAVSYAPSSGYCYLKNQLNAAVQNYGVWGAQVITNNASAASAFVASCPTANSTTITDTTGASYFIECGLDRPGGDYQQIYTNSLNQCLSSCSNSLGCVDVSWVPGQNGKCYLKNSLASSVGNPGVWGARLLTNETTMPVTYNDVATCAVSFISGSAGCGNPLPAGQKAGDGQAHGPYNFVLKDGEVRQYWISIPPNYSPTKPSPMIFSFHGNGDNGYDQAGSSLSNFQNPTVNPNAIGVYPQGVHGSWQGAPYSVYGIDDISFTKQLMNYISATYCTDPTRYYATGHSNGGGFTGTLACDPMMSQLFAAFGAHSGAFYPLNNNTNNCNPSAVVNPCNPGRTHIPFIEFHGDNDGQINITGGVHGSPYAECLPSIAQYMSQWAIREGFTNGTGVAVNPTFTTLNNTSNQTMAYEYQWGTSNSGIYGEVTRYIIPGLGHVWANQWNGFSSTPYMLAFLNQWTLFNDA